MVEIHSAKPAMEREDRHLEEEIPTHVQLPFDFIWGLYMDLYHIYIYIHSTAGQNLSYSLCPAFLSGLSGLQWVRKPL